MYDEEMLEPVSSAEELTDAYSTSTALMDPYDLGEMQRKLQMPSTRSIRLDGKIFKLPDGTASPGPMRCIVLDYIYLNSYYPGAYNPKNIVPPQCWAFGETADTPMSPDPRVVKTPVSESCSICPNNQWNSHPGGGKGKACQNRIVMAVISPDDAEKGEILRLALSPKGLGYWNAYVGKLKETYNKHFRQVITKITFDEGEKVPVLRFAMEGPHNVDKGIISTRFRYVEQNRILLRDPTGT